MSKYYSPIIFLSFSVMMLFIAAIFISTTAYAANPPSSPVYIDDCLSAQRAGQGLSNSQLTDIKKTGLTQRVIYCTKGTIRTAVTDMLGGISNYMRPITGYILTLAIAIFGIRIIGGERQIQRRAFGFILRIGLVVMFSYNLGGYTDAVFGVFDQLTNIAFINATVDSPIGFVIRDPVSGNLVAGSSPWQQMDNYIGVFLGFASGTTLLNGFIGMLAGAMYSSTIGILVFLTGVMAILNIFFFVLRIIFAYLTAFTVISFLIILSPFLIPLALFFYTERYFTKWLHFLFSAMLMPMILFAFLSMFLKIFGQLIGEIFCPLGFKLPDLLLVNPNPAVCTDTIVVDARHPVDFRAFFKMNQPLFSWLMPADPGSDNELQALTENQEMGVSSVQSNVNPFARRAMNAGSMELPGVNFGTNNEQTMQSLVFAFVKLWIFGTIMTGMVKKIPAIAADIGLVNYKVIGGLSATRLESGVKSAVGNFKERLDYTSKVREGAEKDKPIYGNKGELDKAL